MIHVSLKTYIYIHVPNCMYVHNMHICIFTYIYIHIYIYSIMFLECMDFWTEFDFVVEVRISLVFSEGGGYTRKDCSVLPLCFLCRG